MSLNYLAEKIKSFYFLIFFAVIAAIFFALGRLSAIEERHQPVKIIQPASEQTANAISSVSGQSGDSNITSASVDSPNSVQSSTQNASANTSAISGEVVASKNGTKYYFPWCGGVKLIKPENQITFASADLARAAGYTPAANCKGLK